MSALLNDALSSSSLITDPFFTVTSPVAKPLTHSADQGSNLITIKQYLQRVVFKQNSKSVTQLPSMMTLASMFEASLQDIQRVFVELRQMGFDYTTPAHDAPIVIWDTL